MGTFSEMIIDSASGAEEAVQEVVPFTLEQGEPDPAAETFGDEEKQAAEAESAQAALAFLKQQEGDGADSVGAGAEKEAAAPTASAEEMKRLHEEQEAKRKAEWEARQAAKEEAELIDRKSVV